MSDHPFHIWHDTAAGVVRCAYQGCTAEPTPLEAAQVIAEADTRAAMRVELDWLRARPQ